MGTTGGEERRGNGKIPTGGWTDDNDYDDDALNRVQVKMQCELVIEMKSLHLHTDKGAMAGSGVKRK